MKTNTLSRRIRSPEDILVGDFVAITHTRYQLLPDNLDVVQGGAEVEPIYLTAMPSESGTPLKVVALCLPFLMTEDASGMRIVVDTRREVLIKVSTAYAKAAKRADKNKKGQDKKRKRKGKRKKKNK